MQIHTLLVVLLSTTIATSSFAQQKQNSILHEARQAIEKSNAIYFDSFAKNDPNIFIDRYADDGCIMASNSVMECGEDGFRNFFKDSYSIGIRGGKFVTAKIYGDAKEFVVEEGLGQIFSADGKVVDEFKYLVLWKKTNKGWKMFRDSFNSNLPTR